MLFTFLLFQTGNKFIVDTSASISMRSLHMLNLFVLLSLTCRYFYIHRLRIWKTLLKFHTSPSII
jgi:hypothetical protein